MFWARKYWKELSHSCSNKLNDIFLQPVTAANITTISDLKRATILKLSNSCYFHWQCVSVNTFIMSGPEKPGEFKVHMMQKRFFQILKVQHFKDTVRKFELCLKKIGDFISPESCDFGLKNGRPKCWAAKISDRVAWWRSVVDKTTRL